MFAQDDGEEQQEEEDERRREQRVEHLRAHQRGEVARAEQAAQFEDGGRRGRESQPVRGAQLEVADEQHPEAADRAEQEVSPTSGSRQSPAADGSS